jgi:hypothetical protein
MFKLGEYGRIGSSRVCAFIVAAKTSKHARSFSIVVILIFTLRGDC